MLKELCFHVCLVLRRCFQHTLIVQIFRRLIFNACRPTGNQIINRTFYLKFILATVIGGVIVGAVIAVIVVIGVTIIIGVYTWN